MRRARRAVLGGTFDHLHVGHHALLASAFRVGNEVAVGVTTDRFLSHRRKPLAGRLQSYAVRRAAVARWIRAHYPARRWTIAPLEDRYGRSVGADVDILVVSRETEKGGRAVNRERRRLGRPPVTLVIVPLVLADDLEPVSSRRVRAKLIDPDGHRRAPIRIALSTSDPNDRGPAKRAVRRVFGRARFVGFPGRAVPTNGGTPRAGQRAIARGDSGYDLAVRISGRTAAGWMASERSPRVRIRPRPIPGARRSDLERGLVGLLRPRP